MVRPVHKTTEVIPLVHAAHLYPVTHPQRDTFCEIDVMCDEQRTAIADIDNETLVARAIIVV
jgi:hypothetical protein